MPLFQLQMTTTADVAKALSDICTNLGAQAVVFSDGGDDPVYEPPLNETPLWETTTVTAFFENEVGVQLVSRYLQTQFADLQYEITEVGENDWQASFQQNFVPVCIGNNVWICPSWGEVTDKDATVIHLDPGIAFGTGAHATTFLCLEWLATHSLSDKQIMDFGCGSGILAITAAKCGAEKVYATDICTQALEATRDNARQNHIADERLVVGLPEQMPEIRVDIVIANILANPLMERVAFFAGMLVNNGVIVLSGILDEQTTQVVDAFSSCFDINSVEKRDEWVRIVGFKKPL